ncbi:cadherin-like beta sandwich domain-containing protein [Luteolibacter yonseiensis]|uniref:Cadherin-like beta sandwich domain-containing protein n=1 Tax=Luteolibacter yonseiensis TaxID=1144680 RepID=A0A934R1A8_9BACT|nr:ELWxxDGT repeat protein [Luteolibacter yonseiensis]MBK1814516.1 cadherin-like beta sandwich domain-containing protein [Luteolibacter yonseiensis]
MIDPPLRSRTFRLWLFTIHLLAVLVHVQPAMAASADYALLTRLVPSTGTLSPAFSSHNFQYGMALPAGASAISLTATTADKNDTITVNGTPVDAGTPSGAIPVQAGVNTIQINTRHGSTTRSYRITALVPPAQPASLEALTDPSVFPGVGSDPANFTLVGNQLFFTATSATHGTELWKCDGTTAGTVRVRDINPGTASSNPAYLRAMGGRLYFSADDGTGGIELWKSDGTTEGTVRVRDINPGAGSSEPSDLVVMGDNLFFQASDTPYRGELWKSDGTEAGTVLLMNLNSGPVWNDPNDFTAVGDTLYFRASTHMSGTELWKSDGTTESTVQVREINPENNPSDPAHLTDVRGTLYFTASDGTHGHELWKSDGTEAGTMMVSDIFPGPGSSAPTALTEAGGILYFTASDGMHGHELWKSDGTAGGTVMVSDLAEGTGGSTPANLKWVGTRLYFVATTEDTGAQLFVYDTAGLPTVRGQQVLSITSTSGIFGGEVTSIGNSEITARGIVFSPADINADPRLGGNEVALGTSAGSLGTFELQNGNLTAGTVYAYRAYATNVNGTAYSALGAFATLSGLTPTEYWRDTYFGNLKNTGTAADLADPDHDGVVNLLERAFRLHPLIPGSSALVPGNGTTGLPSITLAEGPQGHVLTIEYVRLKASGSSGPTYTPQFCTDLNGPWQNHSGDEIVQSIDADWERVTVRAPATEDTPRFARVRVVAVP